MSDEKVTAFDIHQALLAKYGGRSQGRDNEKWVCIPEARSGAGFGGNDGSCDFLAINTWPSQGHQVIGHEIKISVTDWRRELVKEDKAERFARHCNRWWIVVPQAIAQTVENELPDTWGLLVLRKHGEGYRLIEKVSAPKREPEPIPYWWWVGWMAQIDRREKRALTQAMQQEVSKRVKVEVEREIQHLQRRADPSLNLTRQDAIELQDLRAKKAELDRIAHALELRVSWGAMRDEDLQALAAVWRMRRNTNALQGIRHNMRNIGELLDALEGAQSV